MNAVLKRVLEQFPERCQTEALLAPLSTWKIGGPAELLFRPESAEELAEVLQLVHAEGLPVQIIGKASNLLIDSAGLRGLVIQLGQGFAWIQVHGEELEAGAATAATSICRSCITEGLTGLEFMTGIPATLGGMIRMNAGAHGTETADHLLDVDLLGADGTRSTRSAAELDLTYRKARGLASNEIVIQARFQLRHDSATQIQARIQSFQDYRRSTQPLRAATCGSVFRRPAGDYPGRLIEAAGLKGFAVGGARVSEVHANFIENTGNATSSDVLMLVELIKRKVYEQFQVELAEEFRHVA
jgi:UDP-N-acetylmuramate dehydrogenase